MLKKLLALLLFKGLFLISFNTTLSQSIQIDQTYIIPPEEFGSICTLDPSDIDAHYRYKPLRLRAKQPHAQTGSTFQVTYQSDCNGNEWPAEAIEAFEQSVELWSTYIQSDIPIRVEANWVQQGQSVLGSAGPAIYYSLSQDFGPVRRNTFYPIAHISAITGHDFVEEEGDAHVDIIVNINCEFERWYFGTDGQTASNRIDLVTVIMHELGHGLGFTGSMRGFPATQTATWGLGNSGLPVIFDLFGVNGLFDLLTDEFIYPKSSGALYNALTGRENGVFFSGPEAEFALENQRVPLFSPSVYSQGSSFSHLDYHFFTNTENALMRPVIDQALAIHSPGPAFCGLLDDITWPLGPSCLELLEDNLILQRPPLMSPDNASADVNRLPEFSWNSVNEAEGYQLQIARDFNFTDQIANEFLTETTFALQTELEFNTLYFWRVRALSSDGNSNWSSSWRFTTLVDPPETVTLHSPADGTGNHRPGFQLRWQQADRADSYEIQISETPDFSDLTLFRTSTGTTFSGTQNLELYTDYYWRVRSINRAGTSDWSNTWRFKTIIERPEAVITDIPSDTEGQVSVTPLFTWQESDRAEDYIIQLSKEEDFSLILSEANVTETQFSRVTPLDFATIYYWRVRARNAGGISDWSLPKQFITEVRETKINPNYPNPFNSVTTLRYQLSGPENVLIDVFDITGRRVSVIVNEEQAAGVYFVQMHSANFASGTYLIRFVAGNVTDIQKMAVIK
jgi:hypothetical protein